MRLLMGDSSQAWRYSRGMNSLAGGWRSVTYVDSLEKVRVTAAYCEIVWHVPARDAGTDGTTEGCSSAWIRSVTGTSGNAVLWPL